MKIHGIDTNHVSPTNNLDVFISIPTNHISQDKIRDLDVQLRGHRYNPIYNHVENKNSTIWVVINNLTKSTTTLHNIFYSVFHNITNVNVCKVDVETDLYFDWVI